MLRVIERRKRKGSLITNIKIIDSKDSQRGERQCTKKH